MQFFSRSSGVLMALSSLPSPYGIGDLGSGARQFLDFLAASDQRWWQILPLGPTNPVFGNSPYMSASAFAGNPLFISPEPLVQQGIISQNEVTALPQGEYSVNYKIVSKHKYQWLHQAWKRFRDSEERSLLDTFKAEHAWVEDYGLFLALKAVHAQRPWYQWPRQYRFREPQALAQAARDLAELIDEACYHQLLFWQQWRRVRRQARKQGIALIGDLPIYVALDSADVWAYQEIFQLSRSTGRPVQVAGVPPDYFSKEGQLWGNPLYRWHSRNRAVREHLLSWWEQRFRNMYRLVDVIRIDHFRGFAAYWSVPATDKTAVNGRWKKGPGRPFFRTMEQRLGTLPIIAEDLGVITPDVEQLRDGLGFPGMKVLLFAFDTNPDNTYLPHNIGRNAVVYTGTHDNDTAVGWFLNPQVPLAFKCQAKQYANRMDNEAGTFHRDLIHLAFGSRAQLAIIPMQDVLGFGNDCRMNIPGTTSHNWQWRLAARFLTPETAHWLGSLTRLFGRA